MVQGKKEKRKKPYSTRRNTKNTDEHTHTQKKSKKPHPGQGKEGGYGGFKGHRYPALSATCACVSYGPRKWPGVLHAQRGVANFRACVLVRNVNCERRRGACSNTTLLANEQKFSISSYR